MKITNDYGLAFAVSLLVIASVLGSIADIELRSRVSQLEQDMYGNTEVPDIRESLFTGYCLSQLLESGKVDTTVLTKIGCRGEEIASRAEVWSFTEEDFSSLNYVGHWSTIVNWEPPEHGNVCS